MVKVEFDKKQLLAVLDSVIRKTMATDLIWDWPCGVAHYGVSEAFLLTGNEEYLEMLTNWTDEYTALGLPAWTVNTCAMGHSMLVLHEATGKQEYLDLVMSKIDYLRNKALRFGDSVLQHTVSVNNDFPEQAWADTLFMAAFFMLRVGVKMNDKALIDDALNQYYWHIKYLQNHENGLWYHGYNNINKDHMSGFYWARANSWAAYTMSQVKRRLPQPYLYPPFMEIDCALRDQLAGLKLTQTENGLWRTILDDNDSYEEISASCGIAAAMVENQNQLHSKYVQKALGGILANIAPDGSVLNVSGGTAVMNDRDGYRNITKDWIQGWGQGLALAFLVSLLKTDK